MFKYFLFLFSFVFASNFCEAQAGLGATPATVAGIAPGKLDITGVGDNVIRIKGDDFVGFGIQAFRPNASDHAILNFLGARGTMASPSSLIIGDNISTISSRAYTGSSYTPVTSIQSFYTGTNLGAITFSTNGGSGNIERLRINELGNVGISGNLTGGNVATSKLSGFVSNVSTETSGRTIVLNDNGMILRYTGTTAATFTLPAAGTLPEGFNCMVLQAANGQITFGGTFNNRNSFTKTAGIYAISTILYVGGVYIVSGEMSN